MSIKHILLPLTGEPHGEDVALSTLKLARDLKAHVSAGYEDELGPLYMPTIGYIASGPLYGAFYEQMRTEREKRKALTRRFFDSAIASTSLPIVSAPLCAQGSAMWVDVHDNASMVGDQVLTDLVVLECPGGRTSPIIWNIAETCLFKTRRPVVIVPPGISKLDFSRPLVAWNGSPQAAHAAKHLMDLTSTEAQATLLQVGPLRSGRIPAAEAKAYLGWHCCDADIREIPDAAKSTGKLILETAIASKASCIVMGAFTRSPTREMLLGGVTDFMLRNTTLPVLLAHT